MKNLLILLTLSIMLFSCTDATYENSADGLTVIESNEILSQKTDTIVVTNYNDRIYVIEKGVSVQNNNDVYLVIEELDDKCRYLTKENDKLKNRRDMYIEFMNEYNALQGKGEQEILIDEVEVLLAKYS